MIKKYVRELIKELEVQMRYIVIGLYLLFMGFLIGLIVNIVRPIDVIDSFRKGPVCFEAEVGMDYIKKCYEIKEVKLE